MDGKIIESGVSGKLLEWVEAHGYNGEYINEGTISCSCVKQWLRKKKKPKKKAMKLLD